MKKSTWMLVSGLVVAALAVALLTRPSVKPAFAACSDGFIGSVDLIAFNYAPQGWAFCDGQSLPVAQNQALYSLIENKYGGNPTIFNLPKIAPVKTVDGKELKYIIQVQGLFPVQP